MPAFQVSKSIEINKSQNEIIDHLSNFQNWPLWSPWIIMEKDCSITYSGNMGEIGSGYQWDGKLIGSGGMKLEQKADSRLAMSLNFIKPFKSEAEVEFKVEPKNDACIVTWVMNSSMPWFLFFMTKMMQQLIGMDYIRGLKMLKSLLETGIVNSELKLQGNKSVPAQKYVALASSATLDQLSEVMADDFGKLKELIDQQKIEPNGVPFTLYESMDMATTHSEIKNCIPVANAEDLPAPFVLEELPAFEGYSVTHTGEYQFMGNAWAYAMFTARNSKTKVKKKPNGLEIYHSDPMTTEPKDLVSEVVLFRR